MRTAIALHLAFLSIAGSAQVFDVDTLVYNGDVNTHINLVILSEGYGAVEMPQFITNAQTTTNALFAKEPFPAYANHFNVFIVKVPSVVSGADHPNTASDCPTLGAHPVSSVNTYFGATFDYGGIHRLLVPVNSSAISGVLASNVPFYDQVIVLVNSPYYGGSGGVNATASIHSDSNEIAIHEIGHSFAFLADEYSSGSERPNRTSVSDPLLVKWSNWVGTQGIGIYPIGGGSNRPHQDCLMRFLNRPFCAVCKQTVVESIHDRTTPLRSYSPSSTTLSYTTPITFTADLLAPQPNTVRCTWKVNGAVLPGNANSCVIQGTQLVAGTNTIRVIVEDTTAYLRVNGHASLHADSATWTVTYGGGVLLNTRVFLEGPYDSNSGLMSDAMRSAGLVPTIEPYTSLGYVYVGGGSGSVLPSVLAVTGSNAIVDWILVELRDNADPSVRLGTRAALLQRDGDVVEVDGISPVSFALPPGTYRVALRHRNHLGAMALAGVALSSTPAAVNFTAAATNTFGTDARKSIAGTFPAQVLWAGDVTFNGQIKYAGGGNDRDPILVKIGGLVPTATVNGYWREDVNMNGQVKYAGGSNDRDPVLVNIGGSVPTAVRIQQMP